MPTFPDGDRIAHISFVIDDLDACAAWFADLTGKPLPEENRSGDPDIVRARYHGTPNAASFRMRTFRFANIDIEFIQPGPEPSIWRDFLDQHGPGCHHIGFRTHQLGDDDAYLERKGHAVVQEGDTAEVPGHYAYYDTRPQLGVYLELLELPEPG